MFGCLVNVPCGSCRCRAGGDFSLSRRGHPLIHGTQCLVVFRASAYFRGLSICRVADVCPVTVLVLFLRFAICALFGIVVIRAGGAVDRHPDLLVPATRSSSRTKCCCGPIQPPSCPRCRASGQATRRQESPKSAITFSSPPSARM